MEKERKSFTKVAYVLKIFFHKKYTKFQDPKYGTSITPTS
jgi:hypothetical protein